MNRRAFRISVKLFLLMGYLLPFIYEYHNHYKATASLLKMELVCFQGVDKENWAQLNALIKKGEWEKIVILKNKNAEHFSVSEHCEVIDVDSSMPLLELKGEIMGKLKPAIESEFEVALSLASGNGKEHMALISALLSIPVGIRLAAFTKKGIEFLS